MSEDDLILVTGGTGTIGAPLVASLAGRGATVVSLARGPHPGTPAGVRVLSGDILRGATLGIDDTTAAAIRARVKAIVHAAAITRFDAPLDRARETNVDGTGHVLAFAAQCPRLERICALSTVYVAGRRTGHILERELEHDCGFVNNYEQSKHESEQLLRDWMGRLPIAICRLSTTLGDSASGRVDRPAAIHQAIRFLHHSLLPMIPGSPESAVDLIPTDYAVAAIRHLSGPGFVAGATFHISAGTDALREDELIDLTVDTFLRHRPAWRRRAIEKPVIVALDTFELFRRSVEEVADSALAASVAVLGHFAPQLAFPKTFDDEGCRASLARAGIHRPPVRDTLINVVKYLLDHDWGTTGASAPLSDARSDRVTTFADALMRFVREDLLEGRDVPIEPDTYLFEDGVVDSLGILTLIAFVEQQCGRTIPDSEIVMEHFRSIRAITRHFHGAS